MAALRQLALGCCILCASAGVIQIFWPENRLKSVINTVLLLYILTSALSLGKKTDWNRFRTELQGWASQKPTASAQQKDYADYLAALGQDSTAEGLEKMLEDHGITAQVRLEHGGCRIVLPDDTKLGAAQELLRQNAGTMPYTLQTEDENP